MEKWKDRLFPLGLAWGTKPLSPPHLKKRKAFLSRIFLCLKDYSSFAPLPDLPKNLTRGFMYYLVSLSLCLLILKIRVVMIPTSEWIQGPSRGLCGMCWDWNTRHVLMGHTDTQLPHGCRKTSSLPHSAAVIILWRVGQTTRSSTAETEGLGSFFFFHLVTTG